MTLGWTDGNTFLPVNSCLLASSKERNLIGPTNSFDGRSLAAKRRKLAQTKGTDVMIELLKNTQAVGYHADYVLLDTWFSSPAQLIAVKNLGLDSIAMIKKSSRIYYEYEEKQLSIQKIFGICKKCRGRSKHLLSVNVMVGKDHKIAAKIVCTLGEIFFLFTDELADITFGESFQIIINAMMDCIYAIFQPTDKQLKMFIEMFVGRLPDYIRNSLTKANLVV